MPGVQSVQQTRHLVTGFNVSAFDPSSTQVRPSRSSAAVAWRGGPPEPCSRCLVAVCSAPSTRAPADCLIGANSAMGLTSRKRTPQLPSPGAGDSLPVGQETG